MTHEPKWTPGRWVLDRSGNDIFDEAGELLACAYPMTADTAHGRDSYHTANRNARLIAAAPDLYEALEAVQWGNTAWDPESGEQGAEYSLCPMCDQSRVRGHAPDCYVGAALASARGEQSATGPSRADTCDPADDDELRTPREIQEERCPPRE